MSAWSPLLRGMNILTNDPRPLGINFVNYMRTKMKKLIIIAMIFVTCAGCLPYVPPEQGHEHEDKVIFDFTKHPDMHSHLDSCPEHEQQEQEGK